MGWRCIPTILALQRLRQEEKELRSAELYKKTLSPKTQNNIFIKIIKIFIKITKIM